MQVILLNQVPKLGNKFEVVNVSEGYATNFLIPQGLARTASPQALQALETERAQHEEELKAKETETLEKLRGISSPLTFGVKANEQGHLFGAITTRDIVQKLNTEHSVTLSEDHLKMEHPFKQVGTYEVTASLAEETVAIPVEITATE